MSIGSRMVVPKEKFIQWVEEHTKAGGDAWAKPTATSSLCPMRSLSWGYRQASSWSTATSGGALTERLINATPVMKPSVKQWGYAGTRYKSASANWWIWDSSIQRTPQSLPETDWSITAACSIRSWMCVRYWRNLINARSKIWNWKQHGEIAQKMIRCKQRKGCQSKW